MREKALRALAVVVPAMPHSPIWRSDGQAPTVKLTTTPVSVLGSLVDYLIKSRVDVVCKLDLSNWSAAKSGCPNSKPDNSLHCVKNSQDLQWLA